MRALLVMGLALAVSLAFFVGTASADEGYYIVMGGKSCQGCGDKYDCGGCKPKCDSCTPCKPACKMETCTPVCEEPKCEPCFPEMPCEYPDACAAAAGEFDRKANSRKSA